MSDTPFAQREDNARACCTKFNIDLGMPSEKAWSRDEHLKVIGLYFRIPFGRFHKSNSEVMALAHELGRTPSAVAMKLGNFASLDPALHAQNIKGLSNVSKDARAIWNEYLAHPLDFVVKLHEINASGNQGKPLPAEEEAELRQSTERVATRTERIGQQHFRTRVLAMFENTCCITGICDPRLLIASHIIPWAQDASQRLNPKNGLCLNGLHDRAFEARLMYIDDDLTVKFDQSAIRKKTTSDAWLAWMTKFEGEKIRCGKNFEPDRELLRRHRERAP